MAAAPPAKFVLFVDDHPLVRQGVRSLFERELGLITCGEAETLARAYTLAEENMPQLAVVDITLRAESGLELTTKLAATLPAVRVLIMSTHDEAVYGEKALRAGAWGFVGKQASPAVLVAAARAILDGKICFCERVLKTVFGRKQPGYINLGKLPPSILSGREREVLKLLGQGWSTRSVAEELNLSAKTIETYRDNLKLKLDLPDSHALIHYAVQWARSEEFVT